MYLGEPQIAQRRGDGHTWTLIEALEPDTLSKEAVVTLREITKETLRAVLKLKVSEYQNRFVAPNPISVSEAHFEPKAWFRAIYADETPVGFVMMYIDPEEDDGVYYLWRYMVDARYQGKGFGRRALEQVIAWVKSEYPNAKNMKLSYVPKPGNPQPFYARLGFVDTGVEHGGEMEMQLKFVEG
jgi:diamine N-acetyltransferase